MKKKIILTGFLVSMIIGILYATTWFDTEVKCPICKTKNTFKKIGSYGGYIYRWPSKFEYIYWPVTETYSLYSCRKCRYSALMWDFKNITGDTLQLVKNAMDTIQIEMKAKKDYAEIPMTDKLETAELFYKLYETDKDFWCKYYRIKGYHYHLDKEEKKAKENRLKALSIANDLLADTSNAYRKKELLFITGAMKHFTNQDSLALVDFELAKTTEYFDPSSDSIINLGMNRYFDELLVEYVILINDSIK